MRSPIRRAIFILEHASLRVRLLTLTLFLAAMSTLGQPLGNISHQWSRGAISDTTGGNCIAGRITRDNAGNLYSYGTFSGTADFDPSSAVFKLCSTTSTVTDLFIAAFNSSGNFLFVKSLSGTGT